MLQTFGLACLAINGFPQGISLSSSLSAPDKVVLRWEALPAAQGYRVEYRDALAGSPWLPCPWQDQWPVTNLAWTNDGNSGPARFYRLMALTSARGAVVSSAIIGSYTAAQLGALFAVNYIPITPMYAVTIYAVNYQTVSADGAPARASGALVIPQNAGRSLPLMSAAHGTVVLTNQVASRNSGDILLGAAWASIGYATALPDYLGLGSSAGLHPYVHARSEATAAIDLLRASRNLCAQWNVPLNGQVFLAGYSQGGHATMAAHREIERYYAGEFSITASAPMAGPYDLSGATMTALLQTNQAYISPWYIPYLILAYNSVYRLYPDISQVLKAPYATALPPLFDGQHSGEQIDDAMPPVPSEIFHPLFLEEFRTNSAHPFKLALQRNDLYDWRPVAPLRLFHSAGDTTVPYSNSVIARNTFHTNGATQVLLVDPYPAGNHSTGALPCFIAAKNWFETFRN